MGKGPASLRSHVIVLGLGARVGALLAAAGLLTLYSGKPTFGSNWPVHYLGLFVWGLGSEAGRSRSGTSHPCSGRSAPVDLIQSRSSLSDVCGDEVFDVDLVLGAKGEEFEKDQTFHRGDADGPIEPRFFACPLEDVKIHRDERLEPIDADTVIRERYHMVLSPFADRRKGVKCETTAAQIFEEVRQDDLGHFHEKIDVFREARLESIRSCHAADERVQDTVCWSIAAVAWSSALRISCERVESRTILAEHFPLKPLPFRLLGLHALLDLGTPGERCTMLMPSSISSAIWFQRPPARIDESPARAWASAAGLGNLKGKPVAGSTRSFVPSSSSSMLAQHALPVQSAHRHRVGIQPTPADRFAQT